MPRGQISLAVRASGASKLARRHSKRRELLDDIRNPRSLFDARKSQFAFLDYRRAGRCGRRAQLQFILGERRNEIAMNWVKRP